MWKKVLLKELSKFKNDPFKMSPVLVEDIKSALKDKIPMKLVWSPDLDRYVGIMKIK